jgi:hypothetical protein
MFFTARFSTTITWFSLTILRDSLCRKSSRTLAIFAWTLATAHFALRRRLVVLSFFLDNLRCLRFRMNFSFNYSKIARKLNLRTAQNFHVLRVLHRLSTLYRPNTHPKRLECGASAVSAKISASKSIIRSAFFGS